MAFRSDAPVEGIGLRKGRKAMVTGEPKRGEATVTTTSSDYGDHGSRGEANASRRRVLRRLGAGR
jgi:hypothetical protein